MPLQPQLDENGNVTPHDHPKILDDHRVIRRISKEQHIVTDPKSPTGRRISSIAFQASTEGNRGMSVDLEHEIIQAGLDPAEYVTTPLWTGSVVLKVDFLRAQQFKVGADPLKDNPHHGEVWGTFSDGQKKRLRNASQWLVPIPDVSI